MPDPETGLYRSADGQLVGDSFIDYHLPLTISKATGFLSTKTPTIHIRAKITPYAALRQRFWTTYAQPFGALRATTD